MTTLKSKNALLHTLHTTKVESTLVCCYAANGNTFAISWKQLWFYLYILTFSTAKKFCNGVPQGMIYQTKFPFSSHAASLARSSHIYMTVWRPLMIVPPSVSKSQLRPLEHGILTEQGHLLPCPL